MNYNVRIAIFLILVVALSAIVSCATYKPYGQKVNWVSLCELPNYVGDTVFVTASYSGMEEYWSLWDKDCVGFNVELETTSSTISDEHLDSLMNLVRTKYYQYYLKLDIRGVFSNEDEVYGHLGTNTGVFKALGFGRVKLKRVR